MTYWEFGDPGGVPLIALHGMGASGLMFSAHDGFFRARGLRCIAPNLIGGLADPPPSSRLVDLAATVIRLADHLRIEKFQLIAISYGTLVALGVMALAPNRVERAGLFGPLLPGSWMAGHPEVAKGARPNDAALWSTARRFPALLYPMTALFGLYPTATKIRSFVDAHLSAEERAMLQPGHPFHTYFATLLEECGQRGYWYMALGSELAWGREPGFSLEQVDEGGVPLFLETGDHDNVHLPAMAEYLHHHVRHSSVNLVAGQGRFGGMGLMLEAGINRFLATRATHAPV
ncbi:alpha/beta fold hydrolase [Vitiosangium sp. GDMCC 1.1324]|uniref:alpha/beta fold hydrolase n=1 Tax=Vitiosangium sp. (strain GDMCC 1.1324) TaxID=2138576 RepID=UPI00130DA4DF|nr:alpha/beta hydrolase [Vitiosangium sp. GDMCC 1.1324]